MCVRLAIADPTAPPKLLSCAECFNGDGVVGFSVQSAADPTLDPFGVGGAERLEFVEYVAEGDVAVDFERYGGAYSPWTIREKARRGEIPHLRHPGAKALLFVEAWLDDWDEGAELEHRVLRRRRLSPGRIVRPVLRGGRSEHP
jgi:hypothetical protein